MSSHEEHEETVRQATEDGGVASDDFEVIGKGSNSSPSDSTPSDSSPSERKDSDRLPPLWILPVLLGVFILAVNGAVLIQPRLRWMFRPIGYVSAVSFILAATSTFVGLFLIVYAIVLRRSERSKIPPGSGISHRPRQDWSYVKWVVVPLLLGLLAPLATVWVVEYNRGFGPTSPTQKPCIDLYQAAFNIYKDNPAFRMPPNDPDEARCGINKALLGAQ
jgi:hypothetical protein